MSKDDQDTIRSDAALAINAACLRMKMELEDEHDIQVVVKNVLDRAFAHSEHVSQPEPSGELEAVRRDAIRYRWLRAIMFFTVREWGTFVEFPDGLVFCVPISHEKGKQNPAIDAAIDAARIQEPEK